MEFGAWLSRENLTDVECARRLGVSREAVRLWRFGRRRPSPDLEKKILRLTKGAVTGDDLEKAYDRNRGPHASCLGG